MAWGFWNKLKKGFVKIGNGIKKGLTWVNDHIIKPVVKPLVNTFGGALDKVKPGLGTALNAGVNIGSGLVDDWSGSGDGSTTRKAMADVGGWVNRRLNK